MARRADIEMTGASPVGDRRPRRRAACTAPPTLAPTGLRGFGLLGFGLLGFGLLGLGACSDDGRTLRPARADQDATISAPGSSAPDGIIAPSTSAASSVPADDLRSVSAPWPDGGAIDPRYTCDGQDVSPALSWSAAPDGTFEVAVTVVDDADQVQWAIAGLDPGVTTLAEGAAPLAAIQATSSAGAVGWSGPCGQPGTTHTYTVTVWYLGQQTEVAGGSPADELLGAIRATAFARAETTGTYRRPTVTT